MLDFIALTFTAWQAGWYAMNTRDHVNFVIGVLSSLV